MRISLVALIAAFALCGPAFGQTKPETSVHRLRNIAADDAAAALNAFIEKKKLPVAVVAESVTNSVILAGSAAPIRQVAELLASLDIQPQTILASMIVLEAPKGFAEDIGLGESTESNWVLTPRELSMLTAAIRHAKGRNEIEVLSRPQLTVVNNQTGKFEVGSNETDKLSASITPRFMNDGTVNLQVVTEVKRISEGKIQAAAIVADGGTVVIRGAQTKNADGKMREVLVIVTAHVLKTPSDRPGSEVLAIPRVPTIGVTPRK